MYYSVDGDNTRKIIEQNHLIERFFSSLPGSLLPLALLGLCLCVLLLSEKLENRRLKNAIAFFLAIFVCGYVFTRTTTGSLFISYFMLSAIMCSATFILGFVPFMLSDYALMFSAFMLVHISYLIPYDSPPLRYLLILAVLTLISRIRLKSIKGHIFHIWLNFSIVLLLYLAVDFCFDSGVRHLAYMFNTAPLIKIGVWGFSSILLAALSALLIFSLKRLCHDYFNEINDMGKKYQSVEKHFITLSAGVLLVYLAAQVIIFYLSGYSKNIEIILKGAYFLSIFIELRLLTQMFQVSYLRESLHIKEIENMSLLMYSSDLEKNFSEIRDIKHDIKNLFFTMGQYVERSNDEELKNFYKNKIFPFAEGELKKNDLYAKLMLIENEQLRAFLYYKLTQAIELGISTSVEIVSASKAFLFNISFNDIVRILAILIDNAVEESLLLGDTAQLIIRAVTNENVTSIKVQNNVRPETLRGGIKPGVSSKPGGRGRGLLIVNQIISKYDFAALNSYFKDSSYVQNLMLYKPSNSDAP